jgi:hypothetical protein
MGLDAGAGLAPVGRPRVHPEYEPLEVGANRVLRGEPPVLRTDPDAADPLTPKQRAVVNAKLEAPEATQAQLAARAGCSEATVAKTLAAPAVQLFMSAHLDAAGATLKKTAQRISEALDAEKTTYFQKDGMVQDERVDIDHATRLKAAEIAMEGHGVKEQAGVQVNIYRDLTDEQLAAVACGRAKMADFIDLRPAP